MLLVPVPAVNDRLLVRLITKSCPVGTVITTGDQAGRRRIKLGAGLRAASWRRAYDTRAGITPHRYRGAIGQGCGGWSRGKVDLLLGVRHAARQQENGSPRFPDLPRIALNILDRIAVLLSLFRFVDFEFA